ncbi:MAG: MerR family transcriptional regulator [Alphaproteobacteria bacterium]|uniref:MerR family transcriptional regulator n=1 Tax=Candidatus Nitrobium versatile TaxID=2884831 RepID=A0A953SED2_9BACT|nr:MerR family transcriptional regulator [Candidatus Nitrobium versatile]
MKRQKKLLQIGEVAHEAGTTIRTVRYYLEQGFIEASERSSGGFYLFEHSAVDKVRFIQNLKELGLPLKEIKALYAIRKEKTRGDDAYPLVLERLLRHKEAVERKISEYAKLKEELDETIHLVTECEGCQRKPTRENCMACEVVRKRGAVPLPFGAIL